MKNTNFEIGVSYHVCEGVLAFTGVLTDVFDDETGMVMSNGTGSIYRVELNSLHKL